MFCKFLHAAAVQAFFTIAEGTLAPTASPSAVPAAMPSVSPTFEPSIYIPSEGNCADATNATQPVCYKNVLWAMETGIKEHPDWYKNAPALTSQSSFNDFQYALHMKVGPENDGRGWSCTKPCTFNVSVLPSILVGPAGNTEAGGVEALTTSTTTVTTVRTVTSIAPTTTTMTEGSCFPWWTWLILVGVLCCCLGLCLFAYLKCTATKKARKKKTQKPVRQEVEPLVQAPPVNPAPTAASYTMAQPMPMQYVEVAPMEQRSIQVAAPVMTAAPVATMASNVPAYTVQPQYQTSMQARAAPLQYQSAQPNLFDRLDTNHDGSISRAEFEAMGFR